jgi:hypothetical protein
VPCARAGRTYPFLRQVLHRPMRAAGVKANQLLLEDTGLVRTRLANLPLRFNLSARFHG